MSPEESGVLFWIRAISDWGMLILIWVVQLYLYPKFNRIESVRFVAWHKRYMERITLLVAPLMLGQLVVAIVFLLTELSLSSGVYFGLVALTWALTCIVAASLHKQLQEDGKDAATINRLLNWNWLRTLVWTAIVFV